MIYLIGGPPRAGKSQLMNRFIQQRPMPAFSCDFLYDLDQVKQLKSFNGYPSAEILEKARLFLPTLEQLLVNVALRSEHCVIEGEIILPEFIPDLEKKYDIRACFIGLSATTEQQILDHGGYFNWPQHKLDTGRVSEVEGLADRTVTRSKIIEEQARKYNQQYFDLSKDYDEFVRAAINYLLG